MSPKLLQNYGWDLLLGSVAAFYVFTVPYTKVEESFNVQAIHDIIYHHHHLAEYDHFEFPGVVPRTFVGALFVSFFSLPIALLLELFHLPKLYALISARVILGAILLSTLRFLRLQVRQKFGNVVEGFFAVITSVQFHFLFYCTRPLPNVLALSLVILAYAFWLKGSILAALRCLTFATVVFRCDILLLLGPIGLVVLLRRSIAFWESMKCCISAAILCIGLTLVVDSIMWRRILWPELEVFWFNTILNRSSEWGTHPFYWYFTSALPRALLVAYPLSLLGVLFDRRLWEFFFPVFSFILLYSKLAHKELRFIFGAIPIFNLCAAVAASRFHNNRKKSGWRWLYIIFLVSIITSLGFTIIIYTASFNNYPSANALQSLHHMARSNCIAGKKSGVKTDYWVHIDTFSAINGISRFCENSLPWRYSKEEAIPLTEYQHRNFTYLLNEHPAIEGYSCLFVEHGFAGVTFKVGFPPIQLRKTPAVYVHGRVHSQETRMDWPGC